MKEQLASIIAVVILVSVLCFSIYMITVRIESEVPDLSIKLEGIGEILKSEDVEK